ncbi:MAG: hypothetical protein Kow0047_25850 [Anaerolineae bacterium]
MQEEERRGRGWIWAVVVAAGVLILCCLCALAVWAVSLISEGGPALGPAVALIRIEGTIASGRAPSPWVQGAYSEEIIRQLREADEDESVKAIVLRINSPGGTVVGSDEIYRALRMLQKPVVASMADVAASGGYYVACGADYIVANPNTFTGSIGVVAQIPNAAELLDRLGIEAVILRSGPRKAEGTIWEKLSPEARQILQQLIEEAHATFVQVVAEGRGMSIEEVQRLADGRIYSGYQAWELGLVDELGTLDDAINKAAELGGIEGRPRIQEYHRPPSLWDSLFMQRGSVDLLHLDLEGVPNGPVLEYRYVAP